MDLRRKGQLGAQTRDFNNRTKALEYASAIGERVIKSGVSSLTVIQDPRVKRWAEECAIYGHTVEEAIAAGVAQWSREKEVRKSPFMAELLTLWVLDKVEGVKKLRPRSIKTIRTMADTFKTDFGMARIKEVDSVRIEAYRKQPEEPGVDGFTRGQFEGGAEHHIGHPQFVGQGAFEGLGGTVGRRRQVLHRVGAQLVAGQQPIGRGHAEGALLKHPLVEELAYQHLDLELGIFFAPLDQGPRIAAG